MKSIKLIILFLIVGSMLLTTCSKNGDKLEPQNQNVKKQLWTCTMHPQVISDKPGVCPICNMELVKKTDDSQDTTNIKGLIKLSDNKLILANVSTITVTKEEMKKQVSAYSYMDFAEQNRKVISAKFNGRIEKLYINKTGDFISKGQILFDVYSPDLVQVQNEYLLALNNDNNKGNLLKSIKKKLQIYGMTDEQIKELEKSKETKMTIAYHSPISGTVIDKKVQEGMYINEGMQLYDVADMTVLWNIAEIFENDLSIVSMGANVKLKLQSYPAEVFNGKVSLIYPVINSQTRTVKIRSEFVNSNNKLKPQMYGETIFERNFGYGIVVPAEAILFTGKKNIIWVKKGQGQFELREVIVGMKLDGKYQIISGLKEGEEIAKTGGYLIDSESQLRGDMSSDMMKNNPKTNVTNAEPNNKNDIKAEDKSSIIRKGIIDLNTIDINKDGKVFECPMDWNVLSDNPGTCPICKMKLERFTLSQAKVNLKNNGFKIK